MHVRDWMSAPAMTIEAGAEAASALDVMNRHGFRQLPVLDGGRLAGLVTKSAADSASSADGRGPAPRVADLMKRDPPQIASHETVESAARMLLRKRISAIPVVEDGAVVGVITESDLFRALCRMLGIMGRGARLEVELPDDRALVDYLARHLEDFELRNLITIPNTEGGWKLVLRVRGRSPRTTREAHV